MASLRKTVADIIENGWEKSFDSHDKQAVSDIVATFEPFLREVATRIKAETKTELEITDLVSFGYIATTVIILKESSSKQDLEEIVYPKVISFLANIANNEDVKEQLLGEYDLACTEEACLGRECRSKKCSEVASDDYLDSLIIARDTLKELKIKNNPSAKVLQFKKYKK